MSVFGYGIIFAIIGALKFGLARRLNIDNARIGGLISALNLSSFFVVLVIGPLVDVFGHKPLLVSGFIISCAAMAMLVSALSYTTAVISALLLGLGGMCINIVGNTLLPVFLFGGNNPPAALNLGNTFFGLGAFCTPLIVGALLKRKGYNTTGYVISAMFIIPLVPTFLATYPQVGTDFTLADALGLFTNPVIISSSLALFCFLGIEVSMAGWITSYATGMGLSERKASQLLSGFWICMIIARLIVITFLTPAIAPRVAGVLTFGSCVVIGLMTIAWSHRMAAVLVICIGLLFGPMFPTIIGIAFSNIPSALHGSAFGILYATGLLGASTIPAAIGFYSRGKSIQKSLKIALAAAIGLLLIILSYMLP
jgi:fucose permease